MRWTLPNALTVFRVALVPVIVALFYVDGTWARWVAMALVVIAGISDYLDGYLARVRSEQSEFGRMLDPIADKLMVCALLVMLAAFDRLGPWTTLAAVLIVSREIAISGLREFMAGREVVVHVSRLAKWKTTIQMVAIGFAVVGDAGNFMLPMDAVVFALMWVAAILTLITGYDYMRVGLAVVLRDDTASAREGGGEVSSRTGA